MKIKSVLFALSLVLNAFLVFILVSAAFSKTSPLSFHDPGDGYFTAAAVVGAPVSSRVVFNTVEITLFPGEKFFLQYSFSALGKQGNMLVESLYDHDVVSVSHTGHGVEITALKQGVTVMQTLTGDGIKNIAEVTVK